MKTRAFTLIELLIVVAIIAILAAIAVPNFLEAQTRSKISRSKADMRSAVTGLESYAVDNNKYPPMGDRSSTITDANFTQAHARLPSYLTTPIAYLTSLFIDPFVEKVADPDAPVPAIYPPDISKRYVYYECVANQAAYPTTWGGVLPQWLGAWMLYGYGPDKKAFNGPRATLLPYDPTNGTISQGNLVRCQKNVDGTPVHPTTGTYFWP
jgi:prepilin-type N-terminal cleavage/methylation domain-containing protein